MEGGGKKRQLGKILLKQKLVTPAELDNLLEHQKTSPEKRLASTAKEAGTLSGEDLLRALAEQYGSPAMDLDQVVIPLGNLKLIPIDIARQHTILPVVVKHDRLFLAMADPSDRRVIDEIEFVTGRRVFPYVALHDTLLATLEQAYALGKQGEDYFIGPSVPKDYLVAHGIKPDSAPPDPAPGPGGGVVMENTQAGAFGDELGVAEDSTPQKAPNEQPIPAPAKVEARAESGPRRILVVDDEDDIRRLLRRVLEDKGFDVVEATKGVEALQAVRSTPPDLILLDAMLPEVHGFDICRRIKGSQRYGHIPIIMVSAIYRGWRFAEDLKRSYGVEAFLEKPFKISAVLTAVEAALEGREEESKETDDLLSQQASETLERGLELYREGHVEQAVEELARGVQIDPLSFKLHYHLGLLHGRQENLFEAIHELETAVDLQPRNFSALKNLAVLYQKAGFRHKAVEMWERALASSPDDDTRQGIKEHLMTLL